MKKKKSVLSRSILESALIRHQSSAIIVLNDTSQTLDDDLEQTKLWITDTCTKAEISVSIVENVEKAVQYATDEDEDSPWMFLEKRDKVAEDAIFKAFPLASVFGLAVLTEMCSHSKTKLFQLQRKSVDSLIMDSVKCYILHIAIEDGDFKNPTADECQVLKEVDKLKELIVSCNGIIVDKEETADLIVVQPSQKLRLWPNASFTSKLISIKNDEAMSTKLVGSDFLTLLASAIKSITGSLYKLDELPRARQWEGLYFVPIGLDISDQEEKVLRERIMEEKGEWKSCLKYGSLVVFGSEELAHEWNDEPDHRVQYVPVTLGWIFGVMDRKRFSVPPFIPLNIPLVEWSNFKNKFIWMSPDLLQKDHIDLMNMDKLRILLQKLGATIVDEEEKADILVVQPIVQEKTSQMVGLSCLMECAHIAHGHKSSQKESYYDCPFYHRVIEAATLDTIALKGLNFTICTNAKVWPVVRDVITYCGGKVGSDKESAKEHQHQPKIIIILQEDYKEGVTHAELLTSTTKCTVLSLNFIRDLILKDKNTKLNFQDYKVTAFSSNVKIQTKKRKKEEKSSSSNGGKNKLSRTKRSKVVDDASARQQILDDDLDVHDDSLIQEVVIINDENDKANENGDSGSNSVHSATNPPLKSMDPHQLLNNSVFTKRPVSGPLQYPVSDYQPSETNYRVQNILKRVFSAAGYFEGTLVDNMHSPLTTDSSLGQLVYIGEERIHKLIVPQFLHEKVGLMKCYLQHLAKHPHVPLMTAIYKYMGRDESRIKATSIINAVKKSLITMGVGSVAIVQGQGCVALVTQIKEEMIYLMEVRGLHQEDLKEEDRNGTVTITIRRELLSVFGRMNVLPSSLVTNQIIEKCTESFCSCVSVPVARYQGFRAISMHNYEREETHTYSFDVTDLINRPTAPLIIERTSEVDVKVSVPLDKTITKKLKLRDMDQEMIKSLLDYHNKTILKETVNFDTACAPCKKKLQLKTLPLFEPVKDRKPCTWCEKNVGEEYCLSRLNP